MCMWDTIVHSDVCFTVTQISLQKCEHSSKKDQDVLNIFPSVTSSLKA